MDRTPRAPGGERLDPVLVHARRELLAIVIAFGVCMVWSVSWCYFHGYHRGSEPVDKVLGMPGWVFWGIAVPWLASDLFIVWLCFFYMKDDPLGEEAPAGQASPAGAPATPAPTSDTAGGGHAGEDRDA